MPPGVQRRRARDRLVPLRLDGGGVDDVPGRQANCIDGTVLFASLLELANIDPLLIIVPGHAFVGWRVWKNVKRYEFLETTLIGDGDFEEAQQAAQARYDDALMNGYLDRKLFDPGGFARVIDVRTCRARGIIPLCRSQPYDRSPPSTIPSSIQHAAAPTHPRTTSPHRSRQKPPDDTSAALATDRPHRRGYLAAGSRHLLRSAGTDRRGKVSHAVWRHHSARHVDTIVSNPACPH
ncbi:MAG: hypothetical protein JXM73_23045 [Anaerolineae bacterium]|nr:hypothetical protein [Anaerolineae bacterium]